jgi:hypothetical protein
MSKIQNKSTPEGRFHVLVIKNSVIRICFEFRASDFYYKLKPQVRGKYLLLTILDDLV